MGAPSHGRNQRGTTLIEVLTSITVFLLGLGAIFSVLTQSAASGKRAEMSYVSLVLASNHLERLKTLDYADLLLADEVETVINSDGDPDGSGEYRRTTDVVSPYSGNADLAQVTVSVAYVYKGAESAVPLSVSAVIFNDA